MLSMKEAPTTLILLAESKLYLQAWQDVIKKVFFFHFPMKSPQQI